MPTPYSAAGELTFKLVTQRGGSIRGIAVVDDTAYVGLGPRLAALDVSNPDASRLIAQSKVLPGLVSAVLVQEGIAYVGAGKYVVTLEVSDPGDIRLLGEAELPAAISGAITHLGLHGEVLYIGGAKYEGHFTYSGFAGTVDVGRPDRLEVLDWVETPGRVSSLALSDGLLFIGQRGTRQGIYTLDVTDPTRLGRPVLVLTSVAPYSLRVIGQRLYVGGFLQMHAFDITDPHNPQPVWDLGRTEAHPLGMVDGFVVHKGRIYAVGLQPADSAIPFIEVLEPPESITGKAGAPVSSITTVAADRLFVTDEASGTLEIYDISNPEGPNLLGTYDSPLRSVDEFAVSGNIVYLVDQTLQGGGMTAHLHILHLPDLSPVGEFTTKLPEGRPGWFSGLAVADNRAYLTARDGLWVLSISSPAAPSLLGRPEIQGYFDPGSAAPVIVDRVVYLAVSPMDLLLAVDLADVSSPRPVARLQRLEGNTIRDMAAGDGLLYIITEDENADWFHIVDLSGGEMILRSSVRFPGRTYGIAAWGEHAVMVGTKGLTVVSAANPEQPEVLAEVPLPGDGYGVAAEGDLAFVTAGSTLSTAQLLAFFLGDPANPRLVGAFDLAGAGSVVLTGEYVVVGGGPMGVYALKYRYQGQ